MLGEDLSMLTVPELLQLEQQLAMGSSRVQARKVTVRVAVGVSSSIQILKLHPMQKNPVAHGLLLISLPVVLDSFWP
jgi:hypothetical protein